MAAKKPASKPQATIEDILAIVEANGIDRKKYPVIEIGIRGYYLDSMGVAGKNDRGMYDDACFVLTPDELIAWNFNMDASSYRKGKGKGAEKGMAMLATGLWWYCTGIHKGYQAFRQAADVLVLRDPIGGTPYEDWGQFGINQHRGGIAGTSSAGCQTWPKEQFDDAKKYLYEKLAKYGMKKKYPYLVIDETERRKGNLKVPAREHKK